MHGAKSRQQEEVAYAHVLESGLFDKAPRLKRFLAYICELYFEGRAEEIKEYSIATEALGRAPDFDPKKDSIVRVEAHRLRKRLEEFYGAAGAGEELKIVIPNGQYRPHFLPISTPIPEEQTTDTAVVETDRESERSVSMDAARTPSWSRGSLKWFAMAALACAVAGAAWATKDHWAAPKSVANERWTGTAAGPIGPELRILAGYHGPAYTDRQGRTWSADAFFQGGTSKPIDPGTQIDAQLDPLLLRSARVGQFRYDIPMVEGVHELHLLFVETGRGAESSRVFQVRINGRAMPSPIDPVADAGARNRLSERVYKDVAAAPDGKLHLAFEPLTAAPPTLSGIEILPSVAGKIRPVRLVAQAEPVTDSEGRVWAADEYYCGGTAVLRGKALNNPLECSLYRGERFGNFSYRIPLAPGKYKLTLRFAEQWWGTPDSQMAPLDNRKFDVFANREPLLRDFIVGKEAGGAARSIEKTFHNLQPNAQGVLLLEFVPSSNYAEVNAIEVVSEE
jgi:hypothetical protein